MRPIEVMVVSDDTYAGALAADLSTILEDAASVRVVPDADTAIQAAQGVDADGGLVPVVFVGLDVDLGVDATPLMTMHADPILQRSRTVITTRRASLHGVDDALHANAINGMLTVPWSRAGIESQLDANLTTFLVQYGPDELDRFRHMVDADDRARARLRLERRKTVTPRSSEHPHPLVDGALDDDGLEDRMVELLDRALGHPPRLRVAPGTVLIEEGEDVGGIYVIRDGVVQLSSSSAEGGKVLHERSTGAIVGLLSLASHRRAMLECRAVTEVRAIPVTLDQLAAALDAEPGLATLLNGVLIRSLARRLRRADELQVELDQSLAALRDARAQLVAQAKFATLGELAAGLAHELNNPAAAMGRAVEHTVDDVLELLEDPDDRAIVRARLDATPRSAAASRADRRALRDRLGDRALADRLVTIGVVDPDEAERLSSRDDLARVETLAALGDALHRASVASGQIAGLVDSLRSYARGDDGRGPLDDDVDITVGIDRAVRLLGHRLVGIELERDDGDVPPITARPGALQQVWTNLVDNAIDALTETDGDNPSGRITITTDAPDAQHVRVRVCDDGPGIETSMRDRIFEPRFTTKHGEVRFGLGLGLSISRQIVHEHHGTIEVDSRPGRTVFTVVLPTGGPT